MYLLSEWEGRTGKYLARGQDVRTARSEVRAPDREQNIFPFFFIFIILVERGCARQHGFVSCAFFKSQ